MSQRIHRLHRSGSRLYGSVPFIPDMSLFHESVFRPLKVFIDDFSRPNGVTTPYRFVYGSHGPVLSQVSIRATGLLSITHRSRSQGSVLTLLAVPTQILYELTLSILICVYFVNKAHSHLQTRP
jgi:hypothetical protein